MTNSNVQQLGANYANENFAYIFEGGMTEEQFTQAALDHYNDSAEAFFEPKIMPEFEADFRFGAASFFPEIEVIEKDNEVWVTSSHELDEQQVFDCLIGKTDKAVQPKGHSKNDDTYYYFFDVTDFNIEDADEDAILAAMISLAREGVSVKSGEGDGWSEFVEFANCNSYLFKNLDKMIDDGREEQAATLCQKIFNQNASAIAEAWND